MYVRFIVYAIQYIHFSRVRHTRADPGVILFSLSFFFCFLVTDLKSDDVVLDVGCGDGRVLVALAKALGCRGIGVDISQVSQQSVPWFIIQYDLQCH